MNYETLLAELNSLADGEYKKFHSKLLKNDDIKVIGVRIPQLRKIAKSYKGDMKTLLSFPDEFYEVTFIKLSAAALLPYEEFIKFIDELVPLINNWACCDCFSAKAIKKHREEFIPYVLKYLSEDKEFYQRYALTTLLSFYVEEKYLPLIFECCKKADVKFYYVHMAVAWLIAEVLVKHFESGVSFLKSGALEAKTHNKAIQKARESFRLTDEQKSYLNGLKK